MPRRAHPLVVLRANAVIAEPAMGTLPVDEELRSGRGIDKVFTTQLATLFLLTLTLAQVNGRLSEDAEATYLKQMHHLPVAIALVLALELQIIAWADDFARKNLWKFSGASICMRV